MTTKIDVYSITSKANLGGLRAATKAVKASGNAIRDLGRKANTAGGRIVYVALKLGLLTRMAGGALRGIGSLAKGLAALAAGGLLAVFGMARALPGLFGSMRTAMEGAAGAAGGAAGDLGDVAEAADSAAGGIKDVADESVKAAKKITGIFGAFAEVGEGFVQTQGRIFDQAKDTAEAAVEAAGDASAAMEDAETAIGGATTATSRFGKALDRIGAAWNRAKKIILQAIAKAITPALEALADLMESPEFQEFVELLAKDIANAVKKLADWFVKKGIPALKKFLKEVIAAGGVFAWLKQKFDEIREKVRITLLQVAAIILGKLLEILATWRENWELLKTIASGIWENIQTSVSTAIAAIQTKMATLGAALKAPFEALPAIVTGVFDTLKAILTRKINAIIDVINSFINAYNRVTQAIGASPISNIGHVSMGRGAAASLAAAAPTGDTSAARERGGLTVNITVPMTPGGYTPEEAGRRAADSFVLAARAQGIRV